MRKILFILCVFLAAISCERRPLTYEYYTTACIQVLTNWENMDVPPTGMSVIFYPKEGGEPAIIQTNNTSSATVELSAGSYDILVFNQIPNDFSTINFVGMDNFNTSQATTVNAKSNWAKAKSGDGNLARDPEELAVATYKDFVVTEEAIRKITELKSKGYTKNDIEPYAILTFKPKVVIKTTRVRIKVLGIKNHRSTRATLYGMASGYDFSEQKSFATKTTHVMEDWRATSYNDNSNMGELTANFPSFGLPEQITTTRNTEQWADWDGRLDIDVLLTDNKTIVSESVPLHDKITTSTSKSDIDADTDLNVDILIDWGFSDDDEDGAITLPDVIPEGNVSGGFDATIDDWGDNQQFDVPI